MTIRFGKSRPFSDARATSTAAGGRPPAPSPHNGSAAIRRAASPPAAAPEKNPAPPALPPPRPGRSGRRWRCAIPPLVSAPAPGRATAPDARNGAWRAGSSARDRGTAGTAGPGTPLAAPQINVRASSSQMRRLAGKGASASPPSATSRDSSEQSPLTNTSQAISPTAGCVAAWASACSPPPNPTSSHNSDGRDAKAVNGSATHSTSKRNRGSVVSSRRSWRGRSAWPRARPYRRSGGGFSRRPSSVLSARRRI